ncbi:MAG: PorT family protein [Gammaproteobacteria bacterium]|nr:PorT family protein [Gammaproteobacteria bacterium]
MIKKFAIILSCGFLTFSIQAQDFGGGVILGLSTSQVGGDDLAGFHKAGLLLGVFANKSITELLSFQMEMTYIQKGSNNPNMNNVEHPNYSKQDISLSYIEVPLLLQYNQSDKLKIEGGVLTAYLVDGHYNDLNGKMPNEPNPFISYDIGLLLGIDYKYSENISLNTRIGNSILPIGSEDYENQVYNSSKKGKYNSVLSFALHYNF